MLAEINRIVLIYNNIIGNSHNIIGNPVEYHGEKLIIL
jgi:hypothetical protein